MTSQRKFTLQIIITAVALVLVLVYNFCHTGSLLASYVEPWQIGYVAALGIELAVVGLSLQIGQRRRNHDETGFFYFVLISVVVVSALANMSQGHLQRYESDITVESVTTIDVIQAIVGITATALLSLIVMAMAEIVGQYMGQTEEQRESSELQPGQTYTEQVRALAQANPEWSRSELALSVGCSVSTVSRALNGNAHKRAHKTKGEIE